MMQEWFKKAKLGIFIHWGIYAVDGITESWSFGTGQCSYDDYMKQLDGFTAAKYDPKKWAELFKKAGANYVVLTAKHHDGVALFDTQYTDLNVLKATPAGRDLIAPYCEALQEQGLKVGIYFTNTDWSDIDHMSVILDMTTKEVLKIRNEKYMYNERWREVGSYIQHDTDDIENKAHISKDEYEKYWESFMTRYTGEIEELLTKYGDIDLLWFDVMLERQGYSWDSENVKKMINDINPKTVVNSRMGKYGDYETPECYIPLKSIEGPWELCTTFNESWGYQPNDKKYKTVKQLVRMLCECISKGGNMLISIGPDREGVIPVETEKLMLELGEWTHKYAEAIYPTNKGIGTEYFLGGSALTEDNKTLYLFVYDKPNEKIMLNGIRSKIKKITSLSSSAELSHVILGGAPWINMPGCIWIDIVDKDLDDICTVVKIEFEDELDIVDIMYKANSAGEM